MTKQEVLSQEEIEWDARRRALEQMIFDNRAEELDKRYNQLSIIYEVITTGLYRDYSRRDDESDGTLLEWLEYLKANGVPTSYPTWREQYKTISSALSEGVALEKAIRAACVAPRLASLMEQNEVLRITSSDGGQQLDAGDGVNVEYKDKAKDTFNGGTYGEYVESISEMPSSRHASDTIRHDLKVQGVTVTSMWAGKPAEGVEFKQWVGEITVEDSQGATPYQFVFWLEKEMPTQAVRRAIGRLSQKFSHLAEAK